MLGQSNERRTASDGSGESATTASAATEESRTARSTPFRLARLAYGGVLAFMALNDLRNREERIAYAEAKDAPAPAVTVPAVHSALLGGSLGIALWRLPRLASMALVSFFACVTPVMHDFWAREGEERTQEQLHFLKNTALLGAALAFLGVASRSE